MKKGTDSIGGKIKLELIMLYLDSTMHAGWPRGMPLWGYVIVKGFIQSRHVGLDFRQPVGYSCLSLALF